MYLSHTLLLAYHILQLFYTRITYSENKPHQVVIKLPNCTFLLFSTGAFRFMGKGNFNTVQYYLTNILEHLSTYIIAPLSCSTQTISFQLNTTQINLHQFVKRVPHCLFEVELFPAVTIDVWYPLHVNVFATGKVVVLGKNALCKKCEIENWLNKHIG